MKKYIVITTIHAKSLAIKEFEKFDDWHIVLVGDVKSVPIPSTERLTYLSIKDQLETGFTLASLTPENHYARKNIGYLYAIQNGASIIYDTDDDNIPYSNWHFPDFKCNIICDSASKFINAYKHFTHEHIWPRGFPLDEIANPETYSLRNDNSLQVGIWQGLADEEPDVDAIYRLVFNKSFKFNNNTPFCLPRNSYCPINSQNTLWSRELFYLMYLPNTVSFRFTDILRGYVAQRLLWQHNFLTGFTEANVYQKRNPHNLMNDFRDEIIFYTRTKEIVELLDNLPLSGSSPDNILSVYDVLQTMGIVHKSELKTCTRWLNDFQKHFSEK